MSTKLITAGEFAKLSQSTKRTVQWYTQEGLLKPKKVNSKGYRFYSTEQIIDFQVIILLRKLNFSLPEIKKFLRQNTSEKQLFNAKRQELEDQLNHLQKSLKDINYFYTNIENEGVLVKPEIKNHAPKEVFYIEKVGPYAKIYEYSLEFKSYFSKIPKNSTYFALFPKKGYHPHKDTIRIGVVKTANMVLKKQAQDIVTSETLPEFKSLSYTHIGSPALISMIIAEIEEYREKNKLKKANIGINEIEFYKKTSLNDFHDMNFMVTEINIPIQQNI